MQGQPSCYHWEVALNFKLLLKCMVIHTATTIQMLSHSSYKQCSGDCPANDLPIDPLTSVSQERGVASSWLTLVARDKQTHYVFYHLYHLTSAPSSNELG